MISTGNDSKFEELTIADIALDYPHAIKILNRYQIDYSCGGNKLFTEVCRGLNYNVEKIWTEIQNELPIPAFGKRFDFKNWNTDMLIDFIRQNHHEYIRLTVPEINSLLQIVCTVHSEDLGLEEVRSYFNSLAEELLIQMPIEKDVVFPAIKKVTTSALTSENEVLMSRIQSTVDRLEHDHQQARELLRHIRVTANNFETPPYACPTYQMAFRMLEEFEQDVIQHFHLENNVLFPKVKLIENGLETI